MPPLARSCFAAVVLARMVFSQQSASTASPEVHSDGRVTFRLHNPGARQVLLNLEGSKNPLPLRKGDDGTWSYTTEPLPPELYGYSFAADGLHLLDPSNSQIKPNLLQLSNIVQVPSSAIKMGSSPLPWEESDIQHGTVHHHFFRSSIIADDGDFFVYTPAGYDAKAQTQYPVLYLLHGYSDDASGWTAVGKAHLILDTLIAQGKAKPMIVVMPLGYGAPEIVQRDPVSSPFDNKELRDRNFSRFGQSLLDEVMPLVERSYRVAPGRDAAAIAGLSMGGAESLLVGLNRLDRFSYIGAFSAGGMDDAYPTNFPQLRQAARQGIHLLWIACGREDRLLNANRGFIRWAGGQGVDVTAVETPGMHTWMVWRQNLIDFSQLLFRSAKEIFRLRPNNKRPGDLARPLVILSGYCGGRAGVAPGPDATRP